MIHTLSGYIQSYIGITASGQKEQIIASSRAFGTSNEGEHLSRILGETLGNIMGAALEASDKKKPIILADNNYFSEENLKACQERGAEMIIPGKLYKNRLGNNGQEYYEAEDFTFHEYRNYYVCPAGKEFKYKGEKAMWDKKRKKYEASLTGCRSCPLNENACVTGEAKRSTQNRGRCSLPKAMQSALCAAPCGKSWMLWNVMTNTLTICK